MQELEKALTVAAWCYTGVHTEWYFQEVAKLHFEALHSPDCSVRSPEVASEL
jgi:hypothetical protein